MELPPRSAGLTRRTVLRYTALSAALTTLSRLRWTPALAAAQAPAAQAPAAQAPAALAPGLQVLTPDEAEIFTAIVERMVFSGDPALPPVRDTAAIVTIDQVLLQTDPGVRSQLRWLLKLFQWGPPVFQLKLTTFTRMSPAERDAYLNGWATSRLATRQLAFRALKNLSMLGYYSQDATWKAIHYDGPWVPRPRRVLSGES